MQSIFQIMAAGHSPSLLQFVAFVISLCLLFFMLHRLSGYILSAMSLYPRRVADRIQARRNQNKS